MEVFTHYRIGDTLYFFIVKDNIVAEYSGKNSYFIADASLFYYYPDTNQISRYGNSNLKYSDIFKEYDERTLISKINFKDDYFSEYQIAVKQEGYDGSRFGRCRTIYAAYLEYIREENLKIIVNI